MSVARHALMACLLAGAAGPAAAERPAGHGGYAPPPAKEGFRYPDCYCTDTDGGRVEIGERACLRVGRRRFTARCGMSQNSPAWRTEAEGCPTS